MSVCSCCRGKRDGSVDLVNLEVLESYLHRRLSTYSRKQASAWENHPVQKDALVRYVIRSILCDIEQGYIDAS